jgi:perosamine synthetase
VSGSLGRINISGPSITQREIDYVTDAVSVAWYDDANLYHDRFEQEFARFIGVEHAVALPSCTSAIHLSLLALGIGPGDDVVVPEITWTATAAPIVYVGANPIFADVDPVTWCISASTLADCITPHTRAVIPVDLYGNVCDVDAIGDLVAAREIAIVEDAAEAIGSERSGRQAGSFGDTGAFSFHGSKTVTTGEGGMLVTRRGDLADRVRFLATLACRPAEKTFFCAEVGQKYKMSNMQAALGLAQLERIDQLVEMKRTIFGWYRAELDGVEGIRLNHEPPAVRSSYWMTTAIVDESWRVEKEELMARMSARGVDCRPFFYPLSSIPAYQEFPDAARARRSNVVSYQLSPFGVNLPSALNLTREKVEYVADALRASLREGRR